MATKYELNLLDYAFDENIEKAEEEIENLPEESLKRMFKAGKWLRELCWQEIKRMRATGTP